MFIKETRVRHDDRDQVRPRQISKLVPRQQINCFSNNNVYFSCYSIYTESFHSIRKDDTGTTLIIYRKYLEKTKNPQVT